MKHLFVCREYPPAPYPAGGIGTYVMHMTRLLAERGETVHVIGQRWAGANARQEMRCDGRLVIHRIAADDAEFYPSEMSADVPDREIRAMRASAFPPQWFSWVAAGLAERLVVSDEIDVIEAQDWEAPLYYFLLRRSLGLGPERTPPCITHLHSPTEFIFRSNEWSPRRPEYLPMKRLEDHVILAADALLCPSHFLATQCQTHYQLNERPMVVPLPRGDTPPLDRSERVWQDGLILYFGRLEPRKGVIEFVEAAVEVACERPHVRFAFIGADTPYTEKKTVLQTVQQTIPPAVRERFLFHPQRERNQLLAALAETRIAVVPSRWENFPNTALEAMSTGVPVLATRHGGMAEMITDAETGWLASDDGRPLAARMAETLRRALDTSPQEMERMGGRAAASIRRLCDNDTIVERQLAVRRKTVTMGALHSLQPPPNLPWSETTARPVPRRNALGLSGSVTTVVVALAGEDASSTVSSLLLQQPPPRVLLVSSAPSGDSGVVTIRYYGHSLTAIRRLALQAPLVLEAAAVMFLRAGTVIAPRAIAKLRRVLERNPEAGIVLPWQEGFTGHMGEIPSFPYQWMEDQTGWASFYRGEALREALASDPAAVESWELGTAIMAGGWSALRFPAYLLSGTVELSDHQDLAWRRRRIGEQHSALAAREVAAFLSLYESPVQQTSALAREVVGTVATLMRLPLRQKAAIALAAAGHPKRTLQWIRWRFGIGLRTRENP